MKTKNFLKTLMALSGPLANYIFGAAAGGIYQEQPGYLIRTGARLNNPFAIINLRLAILSGLAGLWQFL